MALGPIQFYCNTAVALICGIALWTDCSSRRISNRLILIGLICTGAVVLIEVYFKGDWQNAGGRLAAGGFASFLHGIPYVSGQMGAGDLKLAMVMGLLLGWDAWHAYMGYYGLVLGMVALILCLVPAKHKPSSLPLALFMGIAFYLCLLNDMGL